MDLSKEIDSNTFFSGGAGMFIQYHDIIKPVYLYTIMKMIMTDASYGLPLFILKNMSDFSLVEWYTRRRYINPLKQLDFRNALKSEDLDNLLNDIIQHDDSLYKLSPSMNIQIMLEVAKQQHFSFPIFIYSENYEPYIETDCKHILTGFQFTYVHGDLKECLKKCDQNFTYIFSNVELVKNAAKILSGNCSHIIVANDYRYNYIDNMNHFKYDLNNLSKEYPYARISTFSVMNMNSIVESLIALKNK